MSASQSLSGARRTWLGRVENDVPDSKALDRNDVNDSDLAYDCLLLLALDVSPMGVGLDSKNRPLDLPVSSNLAPEKPATNRERSLGPANHRQRSSVHLGRDSS
jgi:hypothetical protein